jgi:hypothetical protein
VSSHGCRRSRDRSAGRTRCRASMLWSMTSPPTAALSLLPGDSAKSAESPVSLPPHCAAACSKPRGACSSAPAPTRLVRMNLDEAVRRGIVRSGQARLPARRAMGGDQRRARSRRPRFLPFDAIVAHADATSAVTKTSRSPWTKKSGTWSADQRSPSRSSLRTPPGPIVRRTRLSALSRFRRVCATSTSRSSSGRFSGCETSTCPQNLRFPSRDGRPSTSRPIGFPTIGEPRMRSGSGASRVTPGGWPAMTRRDTRDGCSSANTADHQPPIEFETIAADRSSSPSRMSPRNVFAWRARSTP